VRYLLTIVCILGLLSSAWGQQMSVDDFECYSKGILNYKKVVIDKQAAILDLTTEEKGFTFLADGTKEVTAEEGEGVLTLKLPHRTRFLVIKHPEYGQLTWKAPVKALKKKQHYRATLLAQDPNKIYKLKKQWVVFKIRPENAIIQVDSTVTRIRSGVQQYHLSLGKHSYRIESPFYQAVEDTFELNDSVRLTIPVDLQPFYSYLTVRSPFEGGEVFIDGQKVGKDGTSGQLSDGEHTIQVFRGSTCYYDARVTLGRAEKKTVELSREDFWPRPSRRDARQVVKLADKAVSDTASNKKAEAKNEMKTPSVIYAPVSIKAVDDSTEILVNLEPMGMGEWKGRLANGFYAVNTRKDGQLSPTEYVWVDDTTAVELELAPPTIACGMLSVHSNVVGAQILIDDVPSGYTPLVIKNLPVARTYRIALRKEGYRDAQQKVRPVGNDLVDVNIKMKKKKRYGYE